MMQTVIKTQPRVLSANSCEALTASLIVQLHNGSKLMIDRNDIFTTAGASAYIDLAEGSKELYIERALETNPGMVVHYAGLIGLVTRRLFLMVAHLHGKTPNPYAPQHMVLGICGFHIFDSRSNGHAGSIHVDKVHELINWPHKVIEYGTYTLPISIPNCGAGLNIWAEGADPETTKFEFIKYELGCLYIHTGDMYHQIANCGDIGEGEYRITMQGHYVLLEDGSLTTYF